MIVIAAVILGAVMGLRTARRREGNKLDIAQFMIAYAIAFGLIGVVATILIDRLAG